MSHRIILVSHFGLATGMKKALEFIVGEQPNLHTVELDEQGIEKFKEKFSELKNESFEGTTILVSDIPAGSPGAAAYSVLRESGDVHLLSGMNLPLLLELVLSGMTKPVEQLLPESIQSAKETIQDYTLDSEEEPDEEDF